jgi:hypothetical protein
MAQAVGVNLFDATMSATEMFKKLSAGMITTRGDIDDLFAESASRAFGQLETKILRDEAGIGMDESARAARESILAGEFGDTDALRFLQDQMGFGSDFFEGDRMAAANALIEMYDRKGSVWTQEGGQLEGDQFKAAILTPEVRQVLMEYVASVRQDNETAMRGMITGGLGTLGMTNVGSFGAYGGITGPQRGDVDRLFSGESALGNLTDEEGVVRYAPLVIQSALTEILGPGFNIGKAPTTSQDVAAISIDTAADKFETTVGKFETAVDRIIAGLAPRSGGTTIDPAKRGIGDTSSAMAGTLAAHARISGGVAGNRRITSGQRNFNLGSSKSDHFTGNALDLVGANLGGYASRVNASGGFAEMHGIGDTRHLHAVPMGDSSPRGGGGSGGESSYNYTINVTGGPNANANEVANLVMAQIQNTERSHRERS